MGLYQRLLHSVSRQALLGRDTNTSDTTDAGYSVASRRRTPPPDRRDRLLRTPLLFETLEPRVLLSGDPITAAAHNALISGLQSFQSFAATRLIQSAQLAQQLPVVSTSV